jgi:hypothetical protein
MLHGCFIGVEGLEPSMSVPKTDALPLGYTPDKRGCSSMARIPGFKLRDGGSIPSAPAKFTQTALRARVLSASGLEPETGGLKGQCSTN